MQIYLQCRLEYGLKTKSIALVWYEEKCQSVVNQKEVASAADYKHAFIVYKSIVDESVEYHYKEYKI